MSARSWGVMGLSASAMLRGSRDPKPATPREGAARILLYAYTAALSGSMSMLLLKVIGSGIRASIERVESGQPPPLITPGWVLCLIALAFFACVQLGFLHRTLANSPVTYGVPTYQTLLTLLTILLGGIFFSEFKRMGVFSMLVFASGVGLALFGIALHTTHRSQASHAPPPAAAPPGSSPVRAGVQTAEEGGAVPTPESGGAKRGSNETTRLLGS